MTTLYLFKNKYEIVPYDGEILTMRVGDVITKTIKDPTEESVELPDILLCSGTNVISVGTTTQPSNVWIKYKSK